MRQSTEAKRCYFLAGFLQVFNKSQTWIRTPIATSWKTPNPIMVFAIQSLIFSFLSLLFLLTNGILLWNLISHPKLITTINLSLAILIGINATLGSCWLIASALHYSVLRLFSCTLRVHTYIMFRTSSLLRWLPQSS